MSVIENDPSARFQVRSRGELMHPGACMVCGNGTHEQGYVDLGVFYDYEGTMYLCMTCALQVAALIGCVLPEEIESLKKTNEQIAQERNDLRKELDHAQHHVDTANALLRSRFMPDPGSDSATEGVREEPEPDSTSNSEPPKGRAQRKPVVKEPTPLP
jgi:hypothetical protein